MPDIRLLQSICKTLIELLPVVLCCIDLKTIGVTYFWCLLEQSIWWRDRVKYLSTVSILAPLLSAHWVFLIIVFLFWGDLLCVCFKEYNQVAKEFNFQWSDGYELRPNRCKYSCPPDGGFICFYKYILTCPYLTVRRIKFERPHVRRQMT